MKPIISELLKSLLKSAVVLIAFSGFSQTIQAGPNSPESAADDSSLGSITWSNTAGSLISDGATASAGALFIGDVTHYLVASDFNFALPSTAVIYGITVEIEKRASGLFQNVTDNSVRIVKGGSIIGNDYAQGGTWPGSDTYSTYGGNTDLWGTTWTYSDINASDFGVAISAELNGFAVLPTAHIDHIRITVDYIDVLPVEFLSCTVQRENDFMISINWETASESMNDYFKIEKSMDGQTWNQLGKIDGAGTKSSHSSYQYIDTVRNQGIIYYRLSQHDFNGNSEILTVQSIEIHNSTVVIYPNPAVSNAHVVYSDKISEIQVYDKSGQVVFTQNFHPNDNIQSLKLPIFDCGVYVIVLKDSKNQVFRSKFIQAAN